MTYDYATSSADYEEILALRLHAHQAEGHLDSASIADLRSPFDAHSRHLTCRFGGRIVGYLRVIFVDRDPARSQYVSLGGHEVPQWLWDAGFVEGGAGATHPDFQRAGLYVPLMQHFFRVAVQSGHRYVLGACPDELLGMYRDMGFEVLEERLVEPKPDWSFRSHLLYADAERLLRDPSASRDRRRHGVGHRLRRPAGRGLTAIAHEPRPDIGAGRRGGAARRHDLPAGPPRRGGTGHPGRARRAGGGSDRGRRRRAGRAARAARPGPRAARAARGRRLPRRGASACWTAASRPPSGPGSSIRGAAGWCTSCPRRCTASCASTATATRSRWRSSERLAGLRVAVAGLSVGRAVVSTMAHEGIGGELRLADFDVLDLSNLNRVTGGVADVGVNKVVLAAREVAELDPVRPRRHLSPAGSTRRPSRDFVAGADVIVDECDDLEMKVRLREHARAAGRPVVMATSHRGMLDVERFDLEPRSAAVPWAAGRRHVGRSSVA